MAKKLLATFLAALMLFGVFAVAASATSEACAAAEPHVFGDPSRDRVPGGITSRHNRYLDIARGISGGRGVVIRGELTAVESSFASQIFRAETQLELNRVMNQRNNAMANVLRSHGELNVFSAFFSWVGGNFWWLWAPITAAVVGVGAWFFFMG